MATDSTISNLPSATPLTGTEVFPLVQAGVTVKMPASVLTARGITQTLTYGATVAWDVSQGNIATVTLTGNATVAMPTNLQAGNYALLVLQDATGGRSLSFAAGYKWPSGVIPQAIAAANSLTVFYFVSDGVNLYPLDPSWASLQQFFSASTVNVAGSGNITLTTAQAASQTLLLTGAITANIQVIVPQASRHWTVLNQTTGAFTVTVIQPTGTGIIIPQNGLPYSIYSDSVSVNFSAPDITLYAPAGGTSDAITASYYGCQNTLTDGFTVTLGVTTPNATTTPTLDVTLNGNATAAYTIVKYIGGSQVALFIGDLQGKCTLVFDATSSKWVLTNVQGISQAAADARYAPIVNVKSESAAYTVAASDNNSLIVATAAAATQTLPALSTLTSGVSYVFRFLAEAINVPVTPNSADTLTVNGLTGLTTFPMNPGGELIVCGVGGTAGAWICKYIPAAEVFVNNSATDIVLHVGEKCRYAPSAVANLPLHIACNTLQRYRFEITSTSAGQAGAVQLNVNNTTYSNAYTYTFVWVKSDGTFAGDWGTGTAAITFSLSMLTIVDCNAIVSTDTAGKRCTATMGQSDGTTGYSGTIFSGSSDTTTVWTSLGTIANCPAGNVFVERIA